MKPQFLSLLCRSPRLTAIAAAVVLAAVGSIDASERPPSSSSGEMVFARIVECEGCPEIQILVREFPDGSAVQTDLAIGERVVSFVEAKGVGRRAWCGFVYVDSSFWVGGCSVYDVAFGSFGELMDSMVACEDCKSSRRYAIRAGESGCSPIFIAEGKGSAVRKVSDLQWLLELTSWAPADIEVLREALRLVGSGGCPWFCGELVKFFDLIQFGVLRAGSFNSVGEIPDSISLLMDHEQLNGLVGFMEHEVDRIPGEAPRGVSPRWRSEPAKLDVNGWSGTLLESEEPFVVDVSEVTTDGVALMVGGVKDASGTTMAFLVPTPGEALISSAWAVSSLAEDAALTLWSDGTCEHLALRTTRSPADLDKRAPWLGWAVSESDVAALSALQGSEDEFWPVQEMWLGLGPFHPQGGLDVPVEITRKGITNPLEQPEMLQQYWSEIVNRFLRGRDRLERVEELRIVEVSDSQVEQSDEGIQPAP